MKALTCSSLVFVVLLLSPALGPVTRSMAPMNLVRPMVTSPSALPVRSTQISEPGSYPLGIATDSMGRVWFAEDNSDSIVEFTPSNSTFHTYPIPTAHHLAWIWFLVFAGGDIWFSDESQPLIWSFSPATHTFSNFSAGSSHPFALSYDQANGKMWFTSLRTEQVGFFDISGGVARLGRVVNLTAPSPGAGPSGVVTDGKGDLYVAETYQARIVELNGSTLSVVRTWQLPEGSEPVGLSLDSPDGRLWFTNHASSYFGYVDLGSSAYREFSTSLLFQDGTYWVTLPYWVVVSSDGKVWFDEHAANRIARFDPGTLQLTEFLIPTNNSAPLRLSVDDSRGVVWFTEFSGNALGSIDENSSIAQSVKVSVASATLGPSASFVASPSPAAAAPTLSFTGTTTGAPAPAFTASSSLSGGAYLVALTAASAVSGSYESAVCFNYPGTIQCGYVLLDVPPPPSAELVLGLIVTALAAVAVVLVLALRREYARKKKPAISPVGGTV